MNQLVCARGDDRLPMLQAPIDPQPLLHQWRNTDRASRGIAEVGCVLRDGELRVQVRAVGPDGLIDWGETSAVLHTDITATGGGRAAAPAVTDGKPTGHYADTTATESGPAFAATYDHGFQRAHLQARIVLGVLVVLTYTEFLDDSGRADYYTRELFIHE